MNLTKVYNRKIVTKKWKEKRCCMGENTKEKRAGL